MNDLDEISEALEKEFGKPRNITEENIRFCLSLVAEQCVNGKVDENVPEPSDHALATTILAVMSYPNKTWEELAQKPEIRRGLKYASLRCNKGHYDEFEKRIKGILKKSFSGLTSKMCINFLKVMRSLRSDLPTKFLDCINYPAQYDAISNGLHKMIETDKPGDAAFVIVCAIEDTLLSVNTSRKIIIDEFLLKKSAFNEAFTKYFENKGVSKNEIELNERRKELVKKQLRTTIGYTFDGNTVKFIDHRMKSRNFLTLGMAWIRSLLH